MSVLHTILTTATDVAAVLPAAGIPDPNPVQPPGTGGLNTIMGWAKWAALAVCVVGLFVIAGMMAFQSRRGEGGEHAAGIGRVLVAVVIISAAAGLVSVLGFASGA